MVADEVDSAPVYKLGTKKIHPFPALRQLPGQKGHTDAEAFLWVYSWASSKVSGRDC